MKITHLLWLVKNRLKDNKAPIYSRISIRQKVGKTTRVEVSTGISCEPSKWDAQSGRIKGASEEVKKANHKLSNIKKRVESLIEEVERRKLKPTPEWIKRYMAGEKENPITLLELFDRLIDDKRKEGLAPRTIEYINTRKNNVQEFLRVQCRMEDIEPEEANTRFINDLVYYFRAIKVNPQNKKVGLKQNYIVRIVEELQRVLDYGVTHGYIEKNPIAHYKIKKDHSEPITYLSEEEVLQIRSYPFPSLRLQQVADIFVFQCYTTLAYAEYSTLTRANIIRQIDGTEYIIVERQKSKKHGSVCQVPLLKEAKAIIDKYATHPECELSGRLFPLISNQKTNQYLKEVGRLLGIKTNMSSHLGRRTGATMFINNKMPLHILSKILGHKSTVITERRYAFLLIDTITEEAQKVQEKLKKLG